MTEPINTDTLPPVQHLCMEVLAARHRLGESLWTFRTREAGALYELESRGLVWTMPGIVERSLRAGLTEAGIAACTSPTYKPPPRGPGRRVAHELRRLADELDVD